MIFIILTQILMLYKVNNVQYQLKRLKLAVNELQASIFQPQNPDEEKIIINGIAQVIVLQIVFFLLCINTICFWVISPFFLDEFKLPFAAWYPFKVEHYAVITIIIIYQIAGIAASATHNVMIDSICVGTIVMMTGQMERLCMRLSKIGYGESAFEGLSGAKDQEYLQLEEKMKIIEQKKNKHYAEIVHCVHLHRKIMQVSTEICDIYKKSTFGQFCASCFIICMTLFLMAGSQHSLLEIMYMVSYLITMLFQIAQFCWFGNSLIYQSKLISTSAFQMNFKDFDRTTSKCLEMVIMFTKKDIDLKCGTVFKVQLNLPTLLTVRNRNSYLSYL